jgi:replicative DNA helicase
MSIVFSSPPSELAVLAGICKYGADAYYDVADMLSEKTFNTEPNGLIYRCINKILKEDDTAKIDIALIQSTAHELGVSYLLTKKEEIIHLQLIMDFPIELSNVRKFAAKIRKLEIAKLSHSHLEEAQQKLLEVKGDETVASILGIAEDAIFDFTSLLNDQSEAPVNMGEGTADRLKELAENPVTQMGISTGFKVYDMCIGGGLRDATINVIGARPKIGKTLLADNIGLYIAHTHNIPVLNMDTEMIKMDHESRILANMSEVPIEDIETGQFGKYPNIKEKVLSNAKKLTTIPYYHKSIAGKPFEEQLALMIRWLAKSVGFNPDGTAKRCVIIYDYLKLMDTQGLDNLAEFQQLGFMMSSLHNFMVRYNIPCLAFMQLNRDGITKEGTDTASGSDRIIWLCSNFTIYKKKSDEEIAEDGTKHGNRKLVPVVARHGCGLDDGDYINCYMTGKFGRIVEGKTKLELVNKKDDDQEGFMIEGNDEYDIPFDAD